MKSIEPSKLEMQVLSVLWNRGPSSVREVLESLDDGKARAYTTVLSVMQVMEKKDLLKHTSSGNTHIYEAKVTHQKLAIPLLKSLIKQLFKGSPATALQHLLSDKELTQSELDEIKKLIALHEKSTGKNTRKP